MRPAVEAKPTDVTSSSNTTSDTEDCRVTASHSVHATNITLGAMASNRKGSRSSRTELTVDFAEPAPPISALFLIHFDIKAGYVTPRNRCSFVRQLRGYVLTVRTCVQVYNYVEARFYRRQVPLRCLVASILLTICIVELENVVEYKSLPSGLHNVREDLMYVFLMSFLWCVRC